MDNLTNDDFVWQGLDLSQYSKLDSQSQELVKKRAIQFRHLKDMGLVAELLIAIATELGDKKSEVITAILTDQNKEGIEFVSNIVRDYKNSGLKTSIGGFYRTKYLGRAKGLIKKTDYVAEIPKVGITTPKTRDDRIQAIAQSLTLWEKTSVERVLKTEMDVIEKIMSIADENSDKGLTDIDICKACEDMIMDEKHESKFHLEALHEDHRAELIKRAVLNKQKHL